MYWYKVSATIILGGNGHAKTVRAEVDFPKRVMSKTDNDGSGKLVIKKAVTELGENPDQIDFDHSSTNLKFIGQVKSSESTSSSSSIGGAVGSAIGAVFSDDGERAKKKSAQIKSESNSTQHKIDNRQECFCCNTKFKRGVEGYFDGPDNSYVMIVFCSQKCCSKYMSEGNPNRNREVKELRKERAEKKARQEEQQRELLAWIKEENRKKVQKYLKDSKSLTSKGPKEAINELNGFYKSDCINEEDYVFLYSAVKKEIPFFSDEDLPEPIFDKSYYSEKFVDAQDKKFFKDIKNSLKKRWYVWLISAVVITGVSVGLYFYVGHIRKEALELSHELERIEIQISESIANGDDQAAIDLIKKLVHPSTLDMKEQEFDTWDGYPKYNAYWNEKQEYYSSLVGFDLNEIEEVDVHVEDKDDKYVDDEPQEEEDFVEEAELIQEEPKEESIEESYPYQEWLDDGYTKEEIEGMIEEGYIERKM
tara:strand:+ start:140 stop:1573 length:1434 start_codon:yes stop_codon:yes gene_type:complete